MIFGSFVISCSSSQFCVGLWLLSSHVPPPCTSVLSFGSESIRMMSNCLVDTVIGMLNASLIIWDMQTETPTILTRGWDGNTLLRWSPNGSYLFSASSSCCFRIWETQTWNCQRWRCDSPTNSMHAHTDETSSHMHTRDELHLFSRAVSIVYIPFVISQGMIFLVISQGTIFRYIAAANTNFKL